MFAVFLAVMVFAWQSPSWAGPALDEQETHDVDGSSHGEQSTESDHRDTDQGSDDHATSGDGHGGDGHGGDGHGGDGHGGHAAGDLTAANAGSSQSSMFELRADLAIATLAVFLLLLAILYKFAWGPIAQALDQREQGIANQLEEARRNNEEAKNLLAAHEAKLAKASDEVREILDGARRDAEGQKQIILAEAEKAAAQEKDRAVREISAAKNNALQELAQTSVDHAVGLAGQIVGKQLNKDDHKKLIEDAVNQFPSNA